MPELLILLLMQVTIFSSVTAIIIIAVKQIFKCRIPPLIGLIMWIVLFARLICPVFPESEISIYNLIPVGRDIMFTLTNDINDEISEQKELHIAQANPYVLHRVVPETNENNLHSDRSSDDVLTVGEYFADVVRDAGTAEEVRRTTNIINIVVLIVYAVGIFVSISAAVIVYYRAKRRALLSSFLCEEEWLLKIYHETAGKLGIREDKLPPLRCGMTSMLVGIISPQVVCRENMDAKEASMVFAHELIHYKYQDNPIIMFSTLVACLFWYNPLIWIVQNMLRDDVEVLCDSRILTYCKIPHTEYAYLLCRSCAFAELAVGAGCHMSASGRRLKNRLRSISFEKHKRFLPKAASILLCAAIMMICLTNPIVSQNSDYSIYIDNYAELTGEDERAMHLSQKVTVSTYLNQICTLLDELCDESLRAVIGNGSLENFKRICSDSKYVHKELKSTLRGLRTDEPLTVKNCALINDCITVLLEGDFAEYEPEIRLLPKMITEEDMEAVLLNLSEIEGENLLKCYNKGVRGAEVVFDYVYTDAMMELILDRINNDWIEQKFIGYYQQFDVSDSSDVSYNERIQEVIDTLDNVHSIYFCDTSITTVESATLEKLIGVAVAGQQENVYYLKEYEDGCAFETAERYFWKSGFTVEKMLDGYARIGERIDSFDTGNVVFPTVRTSEAVISGAVFPAVKDAVERVYALGLIDADEDGTIDLSKRLSCGQAIYYAYKLVASAEVINAD